MTCGDCAFLQPLLNFPSVSYFCCFVLFHFVCLFFLAFDIFLRNARAYVRTGSYAPDRDAFSFILGHYFSYFL